jgi:hypothetical protein
LVKGAFVTIIRQVNLHVDNVLHRQAGSFDEGSNVRKSLAKLGHRLWRNSALRILCTLT